MTDGFINTTNLDTSQVECVSCKKQITYYDRQGSEYFACDSCGTMFFVDEHGDKHIKKKFAQVTYVGGYEYKASDAAIPIGSKCEIDGRQYTITGYMVKEERGGDARWREYLLFSPMEDYYITLAEWSGHWSMIRLSSKQDHKIKDHMVHTAERVYERFLDYKVDVERAVGEFDRNILGDTSIKVSEFIRPPYLLVLEDGKEKEEWFEGVYKTKAEIAKLFNISKSSLPAQRGYSPLKDYGLGDSFRSLVVFSAIMIAAVLLFNFGKDAVDPEKTVLTFSSTSVTDTVTTYTTWGAGKVIMTPSFKVDGPTALQINVSAPLENDWVEVPMTLVDETSGSTYEFSKALEFYSGYEGGESWSEGDREGNIVLSSMPSGTYHINMEIYAAGDRAMPVAVSVYEKVSLTSNTVIMILLLLIYPVYLYNRRKAIKTQIWEGSKYIQRL